MDTSLGDFELPSSNTERVGSDSDPNSEKSDNFEDILAVESNGDSNETKKDDDFDNNLPETVTLLKDEETGAKVYLVGTAHFSEESKEDVAKVIQNVQPHIVLVELCDARTAILAMDEKAIMEDVKNINMQKMIDAVRNNGPYYGLTYILLLNLSAHLTKEIGMPPGGEFRVAYKEAAKIPNCKLILGDRPIKVTLLRALSKLTWFQTFKFVWHLLFTKESISKEEIEKCKKRDMLEQLLAEMAGEYPALGEVFVTERDIFLTFTLQQAAKTGFIHRGLQSDVDEPTRVVGVVGIGHALGITKLWPKDQSNYVKDIMYVPPQTLTCKIIKFSFKTSLFAIGGYILYKIVPVPDTIRHMYHNAFEKISVQIKNF